MSVRNTSRWIAAALGLAMTLVEALATERIGSFFSPPAPSGHYEWVVVPKSVEVPYTRSVTLYDHCNRPYQVERTACRTEEVAVRKQIFVRD